MPETPDACPNCAAAFSAPRPKFCPECGQETNVRPPRFSEFVQQFGGAYLATEGALWRTLKLLLLKPGELTRQYLAGRRKHYVLPLRLYLTISVIVLLGMRVFAAVQFQGPAAADLQQEKPRNMVMRLGVGEAGLRDGVFYCDHLPAWLCKRVQRRFDVDKAQLVQAFEGVGDRFISNMGAAMFLLLPSFALWLKLAYVNRHLRYTEHLVFALHVHAFWFLMLALIVTNQAWLAGPAALAVPVYTLLAMRRVYGGRWGPRLLRAAAISALYGVVLTAAMAGVGLWAVLS